MWPLSLNAGERGDALQGTWSTPLRQHIAKTRQIPFEQLRLTITKMEFTCPFVFAATAAPSAGVSTAASSFPAVLEICAPMLLVQQRNPTDQMNEQRPQASFPKIQVKRRHLLFQPKPMNQAETEMTAKGRVRPCKTVAKMQKKIEFLNFFSRAEFVNGEIGPAANEMRSTTPKSTDEWAMRL